MGDAKAPFQTAIQLDPNIGQAYGELARVLLHGDDEAGAIQNWTKAIETKPDETQYYVSSPTSTARLKYIDQAEQVLREGLSFAKEDDKDLFNMHASSATCTRTRATRRAVTEYEAAKKACDATSATTTRKRTSTWARLTRADPPQKNEAIQQLQSFWKITCKGACREVRRPVRAGAGDRPTHGRLAPVAGMRRSGAGPREARRAEHRSVYRERRSPRASK